MSTPQQPMSQLWPLTVTTPAGTTSDAPLITPWPLVDANLDYIDIVIPDGPSGQIGVAVYWSGTQILPWGTNSWLITNNEKIHTPVNTYITVSGLAVWTYNEGIFDHTIYLRALIKYTTSPVVTEAPLVGSSAQLGTGEAEYDNSLTPEGLAGGAIVLGSGVSEEDLSASEGNLAELPESVT